MALHHHRAVPDDDIDDSDAESARTCCFGAPSRSLARRFEATASARDRDFDLTPSIVDDLASCEPNGLRCAIAAMRNHCNNNR